MRTHIQPTVSRLKLIKGNKLTTIRAPIDLINRLSIN